MASFKQRAIVTTRPIPPNRRSCQVVPNPRWRAPTYIREMLWCSQLSDVFRWHNIYTSTRPQDISHYRKPRAISVTMSLCNLNFVLLTLEGKVVLARHYKVTESEITITKQIHGCTWRRVTLFKLFITHENVRTTYIHFTKIIAKNDYCFVW